MLMGRGLRAVVVTDRRDTFDVIVDVDMALVGREEPVPPGVTSPERRPGCDSLGGEKKKINKFGEFVREVNAILMDYFDKLSCERWVDDVNKKKK